MLESGSEVISHRAQIVYSKQAMREQLSPMGTRTAWIQNYKCIFKSVQHFSLTCLLLSKRKENTKFILSVSCGYQTALHMEKHAGVSCWTGFLLFCCQLPLETLPGCVVTSPISQGSDTNAPLQGSRAFLSFQVHVVLCPCFWVRRACKQLKDWNTKQR